MARSLANFVRSVLQADITATVDSDQTITLAAAAAPLQDPPDASADAPGVLVLIDTPATPTKIEVITYTGRSIDGNVVTLTGVTRAQEGTTAQAWPAGTPTYQGMTAGVIADVQAAIAALADSKLDKDGTAAAAATAATATKLETARTISLDGLLGGSAAFDGSGNVTITATMENGALNIAKVNGLQNALDGKLPLAGGTLSGGVTIQKNTPGIVLRSESGVHGYSVLASISDANDFGFQVRRWNGSSDDVKFIVDSDSATFADIVFADDFQGSSDARLKTKDQHLRRGIDALKRMPPREYVKSGRREVGFFAQEVREVLPEAVSKGRDGFLAVSYGQIIALLARAILDLDERLSAGETDGRP